MGSVEEIGLYLEPLRKSVTVRREPAEAFDIFTARMASWWPTGQYSIHQGQTATCGIEPCIGGEVYEIARNGERCAWGRVLAWDPPHRLVLSWHPGRDPETAQEVELRFSPVPGGTRVELEHRGWAKLGKRAAEARDGYEGGWETVLGTQFVAACA